jgi:hypothetical protein
VARPNSFLDVAFGWKDRPSAMQVVINEELSSENYTLSRSASDPLSVGALEMALFIENGRSHRTIHRVVSQASFVIWLPLCPRGRACQNSSQHQPHAAGYVADYLVALRFVLNLTAKSHNAKSNRPTALTVGLFAGDKASTTYDVRRRRRPSNPSSATPTSDTVVGSGTTLGIN